MPGWVNNRNTSWGSSNKTLLVLLVISAGFFLWWRYDFAPWRGGDPTSAAEGSFTGSGPGLDGKNGAAEVAAKSTRSSTSADDQDAPADDKPGFKIFGLAPETETESNNAQSRSEFDQPAYEIPLGDLSIAGRVLTRSGMPVAGAQVTASASYIFEEGKPKAIPRGARQRMVTTLHDGAYSFNKLANGEYSVRTVATERYGQASIQVRAGVDFADLIVATHQKIRVQGIVSAEEGEPLFGVKVRPNLAGASAVTSNREGRYGFDAMLPDNQTSLIVRATRDGYKDRDVALANEPSPVMGNTRELNIVMEADESSDFVVVSGSVKNSDGNAVIGERLMLSSPSLRQSYRATTDINGRYSIGGVEPGPDYTASINAPDGYKDYFQRNIKVPDTGLTLNIKLDERETGVLRGHMVNVFGNVVADYSLVLQTKKTSYYNQRVIGDRAGRFVVEKAPAGELLLKTKSNPYYTIDGIVLEPGADKQITVVLDWGYDEILGRVVNEDSEPVAVPNISLTWNHLQNGIRTTARRTAAADERGNFRFTQLGPGTHRLSVNAAGYRPVYLNHDVSQQGSDVEVELVRQ